MVDVALFLPAFIAVVALWIVVIIVWAVRNAARSRRVKQWAAANGVAYREAISESGRVPWRGIPFPPHGRYSVRRLLHKPGTFTAGRFTQLPTAESREITRAFSFVEIPLPAEVPNIVVTNRRQSVLARAGVALTGGRRLGASTEFDDIFTLYCPTDYERDALYIFTPDLLAILIDYAPGCELELVDATAYLYTSKEPALWKPEVAQALVELTGVLSAKLERQTRRYRDERQDNGADAGIPAVALGGLRLGQGMNARAKAVLAWSWVPFLGVLAWFAAQQFGLLP